MDDESCTGLDDAELVRRQLRLTAEDDRRAYAELVRRYGRLVYGECRGFLYRVGVRRAQDAADLAQETLLRGLRDLATLRDPARFADWVCGIALNVCRNWVSNRNNQMKTLSALGPCADDGAGSPPRGSPAPDTRDDLLDLAEAMARLPENWRRALLLRLEGHSYQEIARALGIKPPTVNAWLTQARNLLRQRLGPPARDGHD
jgi:RNA polymerase sigma-70 factor (ECF subfamily)